MTQCINLRERFGHRYKVKLEEPATCFSDPWFHIIPCRHGHIYPHGDDELGFASDKNGQVADRVSALPFTTVAQAGADGVNVIFDVRFFDRVAEIVKPKRRKRLAEDHRRKLIEAGRQNRFGNRVEDSSGDNKPVQKVPHHSGLGKPRKPIEATQHRRQTRGRSKTSSSSSASGRT